MSSVTIPQPDVLVAEDKRRRALTIVVACTFVGAAAQVLIKAGANHLPHASMIQAVLGIITNPMLFSGYALLGVFTAALVFALRDGELSILYPIIALTYVWVLILSVLIFHERMNPMKGLGVCVIVLGVAILGRGGSR